MCLQVSSLISFLTSSGLGLSTTHYYFLNIKQRDSYYLDHGSLGQQPTLAMTKAMSLPPITSALKGVLASAVVDEADYYQYLEDKYLGKMSL